MKAFLMYRDRDFDPKQELPLNAQALMQDLELKTLLEAMAGGDEFLFAMARQAVLTSLYDPEAIRYRQDILRDCLKRGEPASFPQPMDAGQRRHSFAGLYDVCLALTMKQPVVGNDINADSKDLVVITGANQGGKSTFLRSVGLAQLMMQCGMFVPAESFCASTCAGLFTHYKREEDAAMKSGKLDEELARMSSIVDQIGPNGMVLFNESFAATNEREGSEIARQIVSALLKRRIRVFFVTHLYAFAHGMYKSQREGALFLLAERQASGRRTFRVIEGQPLQTSYGGDLYKSIFEGGVAMDGNTNDAKAQLPEAEPLGRPRRPPGKQNSTSCRRRVSAG